MTRITPVQHRKIVRVLELEGFVLARQRGSHMVFVKTGIERPVVVPGTIRYLFLSSKTFCGRRASVASAISNFSKASRS